MDIRRYTALVVDDNEPTRALIGKILAQELDVLTVPAGSCEQALRLVEQREFDIILLDLLMPGVGGFEVLKAIRSSESRNRDTPVIILSVLDDRESVDRCMSLKAHAFVTKPVNRDVIAGIVRAHLPNGLARSRRTWRQEP